MEMLRIIVQSKFSLGFNRLEDVFVGRGNFCVEVKPDFLVLFKNQQKKKQLFSTETKKQLQKLKQTEITMYIRRFTPSSKLHSLC